MNDGGRAQELSLVTRAIQENVEDERRQILDQRAAETGAPLFTNVLIT
jgi:hypothetical protein